MWQRRDRTWASAKSELAALGFQRQRAGGRLAAVWRGDAVAGRPGVGYALRGQFFGRIGRGRWRGTVGHLLADGSPRDALFFQDANGVREALRVARELRFNQCR